MRVNLSLGNKTLYKQCSFKWKSQQCWTAECSFKHRVNTDKLYIKCKSHCGLLCCFILGKGQFSNISFLGHYDCVDLPGIKIVEPYVVPHSIFNQRSICINDFIFYSGPNLRLGTLSVTCLGTTKPHWQNGSTLIVGKGFWY